MSKQVIYSECSLEFWVGVAGYLAEQEGWTPCYWVGAPNMELLVKERFPEAVFQDNYDAVRGIPARELASLPTPPVDQVLLQRFAYDESIVLRMMDRMDVDGVMTYEERVRLYHAYLRYWSAVLDLFRPQLFVAPVSPHLMYDYVLYRLCKERGIPTATFIETTMPQFVFPLRNFKDPAETILTAARTRPLAADPSLPKGAAILEAHVARLRDSYSAAMPTYLQRQFRLPGPVGRLLWAARQTLAVHKYPRYLRRFGDYLDAALPRPRSYLRLKGSPPGQTHLSRWKWQRYRFRAAARIREFRAHYDRLAGRVDLDVPFVFLGLHFQPERSTSPEGEVFANQLLMVELLACSLPAGWMLYVKEHPSQFISAMGGEASRSTAFYDRLAALPNVRLVPLSVTPFELIDRAQAVATVTGTTGWEALLRGKPVLLFGHPWYRGCDGAIYTPTAERCKAALHRITAGFRPSPGRVEEFLRAVERACARGYVNPDWGTGAGVTVAQNVAAIAEGIRVVAADVQDTVDSE